MPIVKAPPRSQQNGSTITQFTNTTNINSTTYTYPTLQTNLIIENSGEHDIFLTVGNITDQLIKVDTKYQYDGQFTEFSIRSNIDSQEFIATAIYQELTDFDSINTTLNEHAAQLAQKAQQSDLNTVNANMSLKADKTYVDTQIGNIGNASPKGTYASLLALQTAFPTGTTGIYVVTADGNWYYWNGSAWTSGGIYQSTAIGDGSVSASKLDTALKSRGFTRVKQGIDPAAETSNPWYTTSIGTGTLSWTANSGEFQEGYNYLNLTKGDIGISTTVYTLLDKIYQNDSTKKVQCELTYSSTVDTNFTVYSNTTATLSGLSTVATITLPNTGGVEKTVILSGFLKSNTIYVVPTVTINTTGGYVRLGSLKTSILTNAFALFQSSQKTPIGETLSFWSGVPNVYLNFDTVNGNIVFPSGGVIFRNRLKLLTGYTDYYTLPMSASGGTTSLHGLFYNATSTSTDISQLFQDVYYSNFNTLSEDWVLVATYFKAGTINMSGAYSVNGVYLGVSGEVRKTYTSTSDTILLEVSADQTSVDKADFIGANNAAFTSETGLHLAGKQFNRLRDASFKNFAGGSGLRVGYTVGTHSTLTASDLLFLLNNIGFYSEERAEYITISNSQFNQNTIGAKITGGNVQLADCMITNNGTGIEIVSGGNDSHGIISDCQINHNDYGLIIDSIVNGETISDCHFYSSKIWIKNTTNQAVRFDNCVIAGTLTIENCYKVIFNNCYFPAGYGLTSSVITNSTVVGTGNEVEESSMQSIFNTH